MIFFSFKIDSKLSFVNDQFYTFKNLPILKSHESTEESYGDPIKTLTGIVERNNKMKIICKYWLFFSLKTKIIREYKGQDLNIFHQRRDINVSIGSKIY